MPDCPSPIPVPSTLPGPPLGPPPGPLTFGQILDRTYKLGRANWRLFFGIAFVPSAAFFVVFAAIAACMVPIIGPQIAAAQAAAGQAPTASAVGVSPYLIALLILFIYPILFLVFALYLPAASYAATQADRCVKVTVGNAYGLAFRHFWRYLWLMILPAFYVIVPLVVIGVVGAVVIAAGTLLGHGSYSSPGGLGAVSNPAAMFFLIPLILLVYVGLFVYCIWLMLRFSVAFPASVSEGLTAWASLKRSAKLTKGAKGRIFLVMLVVYAITYAVNIVLLMIFFVVAAVGGGIAILTHVAVGSPAFFIIIGVAVLGYMLVLVTCAMFGYSAYTTTLAVLYNDLRLRKDGPVFAPVQTEGHL